MASGALPPGFPPIEIEGEPYWDGGLVSNTPLEYVLERGGPRQDMCIFQVDLFSAKGRMPQTLFDIGQREKEIRYSSRTRFNTDIFREMQTIRRAIRRLRTKMATARQRELRRRGHHRATHSPARCLLDPIQRLRVLALLDRRALACRQRRCRTHLEPSRLEESHAAGRGGKSARSGAGSRHRS